MKKISVVMLAALISGVGVASAATLKETCLANPEYFVWVEKNNECVPVHPCDDDDSKYYELYCNTKFKDIQVASVYRAKELVRMFVENRMGVTCSVIDASYPGTSGQDYVVCKTSDGGFIEFEFDDCSESDDGTAAFSYDLGKCIAYGGSPSSHDIGATQDTPGFLAQIGFVRTDIKCYNVTKSECIDMYGNSATYDSSRKLCTLDR
jgi:hypothetical protein